MIAKTSIPGITNPSAERLRKFRIVRSITMAAPISNSRTAYRMQQGAANSPKTRLVRLFSKARQAVSSHRLVLGYPIALE